MNLTKARTIQVFGALGLIVLVAVLWFFLLSSRMSMPGDLRSQAEALDATNSQLQKTIETLKNKKGNLDQEREYAAGLAARMPATADQPQLFNEIRQAASLAGIEESSITSITPSVPQTGTGSEAGGAALPGQAEAGAIGSMQLNLTVAAPIDRLIEFIRQLENMPRAYLINTVNLAPNDSTGGGAYTLTVSGSMFVLPTPVDPDAEPAPSADAEDAAVPSAPAPEESSD